MSAVPLRVSTPGGGYDVRVGNGLIDGIGRALFQMTEARKVAVVSDDTVLSLFGSRVERSLTASGFHVVVETVPPGEGSKTWETAGRLLERLARHGLARDDIIVALGGGVIGDLAGFCAATYMRGVDVVQVPTTLLGQVDSAIGGKTAVDLEAGKNLAGAFWQPLLVLADLSTLASLPEAEWRNGLAEVAKSALLDSEASLSRLEADAPALLERDTVATERAVRMAAGLKVRTVSIDEREQGRRESLNYGHTLGHAIERAAGYGAVPHGIAVAEGIRFASWLAERVAAADPAWTRRQDALLVHLGLTRMGCDWPTDELLAGIRADKKARRGRTRMVIATAPGEWRSQALDDVVLRDALEEWCSPGTGKDAS